MFHHYTPRAVSPRCAVCGTSTRLASICQQPAGPGPRDTHTHTHTHTPQRGSAARQLALTQSLTVIGGLTLATLSLRPAHLTESILGTGLLITYSVQVLCSWCYINDIKTDLNRSLMPSSVELTSIIVLSSLLRLSV